MNAIIRRFDRAPLEERLLRANPAQPPRPKSQTRPPGPGNMGGHSGGSSGPSAGPPTASQSAPPAGVPASAPSNAHASPPAAQVDQRPPRSGKGSASKKPNNGGGASSAFAEELAKALYPNSFALPRLPG